MACAQMRRERETLGVRWASRSSFPVSVGSFRYRTSKFSLLRVRFNQDTMQRSSSSLLPPGSPGGLSGSSTSANPLRSNMLGELGGSRLSMGLYGYSDGMPMELQGRIINPQMLRSSSSIRHLLRPDAHPEPMHSRFANSHVRHQPFD